MRVAGGAHHVVVDESHHLKAGQVKLLARGVVVEAETQLVAVLAVDSEEEQMAVERGVVPRALAATALVAAEGADLIARVGLLLVVDGHDAHHRHRVGEQVGVQFVMVVEGRFVEVGLKGTLARHGEGELGFRRHHIAVLRPVGEDVAVVGRGGEGADIVPAYAARALDGAAHGGIGQGVDFEGGGGHFRAVQVESEAELGAHVLAVADEVAVGVAQVERALVGPAAHDPAEGDVGAFGEEDGLRALRAAIQGDFLVDALVAQRELVAVPAVAVGVVHLEGEGAEVAFDEVGHEATVDRRQEAQFGIEGDHRAVLGPVVEGVALVGRGGEGAGLAHGVSARAFNGATLLGIRHGLDEAGGNVEGLHQADGVAVALVTPGIVPPAFLRTHIVIAELHGV